jgi:hypothetical protein
LEKTYDFYGWEKADCAPLDENIRKKIKDPRELYDVLRNCWTKDTCAPRMQDRWSTENPTLGQCSITAFLVQDIFGGKVFGILRPGGNYHCYNDVNGRVFDLTSEQFGGLEKSFSYEDDPEQFREVHFKKEEKYQRYLVLKNKVYGYLK